MFDMWIRSCLGFGDINSDFIEFLRVMKSEYKKEYALTAFTNSDLIIIFESLDEKEVEKEKDRIINLIEVEKKNLRCG